MIQNPKKEITVSFNIEQVKDVLKKISNYISGCQVEEIDEVLNQYQYKFGEFLSLGSILTVNLSESTENKTTITMELSRVVGAYDKSYEVQNATEQMNKFLKTLSKLLQNPNSEVAQVKSVTQQNEWYNSNLILVVLIFVFWPLAIYQLYVRNKNKN